MQSEVVSLRLPVATIQRLKMLAHQRSLEAQQDIRWTSLVKAAIETLLAQRECGAMPTEVISIRPVEEGVRRLESQLAIPEVTQ